MVPFPSCHFQTFPPQKFLLNNLPFSYCSCSERSLLTNFFSRTDVFQKVPFRNCPFSELPFAEWPFFRLILFRVVMVQMFPFTNSILKMFSFQKCHLLVFLFIIAICQFFRFDLCYYSVVPFRNRHFQIFLFRIILSDGSFPGVLCLF